MPLSETAQDFIAHFGEMGNHWGINRTIGQIYALLYISNTPLCAEKIGEILQYSRSNVSMGIKELSSWHLIKIKHYPGDRKDYFTVPEDIWDIFRTLVEERHKREIEPTLTFLRKTLLNKDIEQQPTMQTKLKKMHDLIEMLTQWYHDINKLDNQHLINLLKLGEKVYKLYEMKDKLKMVKNR